MALIGTSERQPVHPPGSHPRMSAGRGAIFPCSAPGVCPERRSFRNVLRASVVHCLFEHSQLTEL
eukprot:7899411-Alexandrium_andersonii.AAC.1